MRQLLQHAVVSCVCVAALLLPACGDDCSRLVDKVCGPGEGDSRGCWNTPACRRALDIRETTAMPACVDALEDEEDFPRCPQCEEQRPFLELPAPLPRVDSRECVMPEPRLP